MANLRGKLHDLSLVLQNTCVSTTVLLYKMQNELANQNNKAFH